MFIHTFLLVFIAEMADKTQLMMMALTNRYRARNVALGMGLGVITISALSVLAGDLIADYIPMEILKGTAALLFLIFGLTNLINKKEDDNQKTKNYRFPIISIAFSFLIAELGDKTQLATVAISSANKEHLAIFLGASLGLILANLLGIFAGRFIFSHLSETTIKFASSFFFFLFGSLNLFEVIPYSIPIIIIYSITLITTAYFIFTLSNSSKMNGSK